MRRLPVLIFQRVEMEQMIERRWFFFKKVPAEPLESTLSTAFFFFFLVACPGLEEELGGIWRLPCVCKCRMRGVVVVVVVGGGPSKSQEEQGGRRAGRQQGPNIDPRSSTLFSLPLL